MGRRRKRGKGGKGRGVVGRGEKREKGGKERGVMGRKRKGGKINESIILYHKVGILSTSANFEISC